MLFTPRPILGEVSFYNRLVVLGVKFHILVSGKVVEFSIIEYDACNSGNLLIFNMPAF